MATEAGVDLLSRCAAAQPPEGGPDFSEGLVHMLDRNGMHAFVGQCSAISLMMKMAHGQRRGRQQSVMFTTNAMEQRRIDFLIREFLKFLHHFSGVP